MQLKSAALALSLCLFSSLAAKADSIVLGNTYTMTVEPYASGENNGSYYVGDTTIYISDVGGSVIATFTNAYCIDFLHDISVPSSYNVVAQGVDSSNFDSSLGGPTIDNLQLDAVLGSQFNGALQNDIDLQQVIWNASGASFSSNPDMVALLNAASAAGAMTDTGQYLGNFAFEQIGGDGQSFMANQPPTVTPEPSSLLLFGTGLLGTVFIMRRKALKVSRLS